MRVDRLSKLYQQLKVSHYLRKRNFIANMPLRMQTPSPTF